jgi:hypothetical protein
MEKHKEAAEERTENAEADQAKDGEKKEDAAT